MRSRAGGHHGEARQEYDSELLGRLMRNVRPTAEEMRLIHRAVARYGKTGPTFAEVLGLERRRIDGRDVWVEARPVRPGIWSIANLIAMGFELEAAA